jgi:hypothetical protein
MLNKEALSRVMLAVITKVGYTFVSQSFPIGNVYRPSSGAHSKQLEENV